MVGERGYRALLLLYPRRFRREYREPMLQLYRDARRDRVSWARLAGDVVVSAPVQHREAFRTMSTHGKLVTASVVVSLAIVAFMFVGGALFALALMLVLAWILAVLLRERDARPSNGAGSPTDEVRRTFPGEHRDGTFAGELRHPPARRLGGTADVR
jgi:hypothetical protein